jgi:hypothetical protein
MYIPAPGEILAPKQSFIFLVHVCSMGNKLLEFPRKKKKQIAGIVIHYFAHLS